MAKQIRKKESKKLKAATFSIYVNAFLIALKAAVSIITGSIAIIAELLHSAFDMLASLFAYFGIKKAEEPEDKEHLYGHEKFENLSSFAQTLLIIITSIFIIYEALNRIAAPKRLEFAEIGLAAMIITIIVDYLVSRYLHRASAEHGSSALEADAYHFTTDLWGALAVIIGLVFVYLGFPVFDAIAAIVVAMLMLWISYTLGKKSIGVLLDKSPPDSVMEHIGNIISFTHGVKSFHKLRGRQAGNKIFVDVNIHVSPNITIQKGHSIAHNVRTRLVKEIPAIKHVATHVEPHMPSKKEK